jgi:CheY-like chemotaxis protein
MVRVLLVDDDIFLRLVLTTSISLNIKDCKVFQAGSGKEAVGILRTEKVDFVLTDIFMQEMDGFELIEHLHIHHPEITVAAMSGDGGAGITERLRSIGVTRFLEKPFNLKELQKMISEMLGAAVSGAEVSLTTA